MLGQPRKTHYLLVEYKPELMKTIVHENLDAENEIDAHREAKQWIEKHHNTHVRLLKYQTIGEYSFNSILYPEDYKELEGMELENIDPQ